jgi:G6PDH family F420-dependent oxidoreductase
MANVGYTLMTEQAGPKDLVRWAARAQDVGFDLLVSSDHYFPWVDEQGHAPNAWVMLGAVAQVTEHAELMTYVTCPTMRYRPAVVAQQAATLALLSDNRFTLGLGAGENLNEHVIGGGWPGADQRQEMLTEAVSIIRALLVAGTSASRALTSGSTRPGSGTCRTVRCRSASRCPDGSRVSCSRRWPR